MSFSLMSVVKLTHFSLLMSICLTHISSLMLTVSYVIIHHSQFLIHVSTSRMCWSYLSSFLMFPDSCHLENFSLLMLRYNIKVSLLILSHVTFLLIPLYHICFLLMSLPHTTYLISVSSLMSLNQPTSRSLCDLTSFTLISRHLSFTHGQLMLSHLSHVSSLMSLNFSHISVLMSLHPYPSHIRNHAFLLMSSLSPNVSPYHVNPI